MMTVAQWYENSIRLLTKAGCDSPAFAACCLLEDLGGLPHGKRPVDEARELTAAQENVLQAALSRRLDGEPLQYILGQWDFLSLTLSVGKGVLIPRPDTELLCETAAQKLRHHPHPRVLDLCAGSGCVGLGLCSLLPIEAVTEVELSDRALPFLRENCARYPAFPVTVVQDDVLFPTKRYAPVDAILSNPPYIPSADIDTLMREVRHEPRMALDGDADGLQFYRAIVQQWLVCLKEDGLLAVEVGIGQAGQVAALFEKVGLTKIEVFRDLGGVERVVSAKRGRK